MSECLGFSVCVCLSVFLRAQAEPVGVPCSGRIQIFRAMRTRALRFWRSGDIIPSPPQHNSRAKAPSIHAPVGFKSALTRACPAAKASTAPGPGTATKGRAAVQLSKTEEATIRYVTSALPSAPRCPAGVLPRRCPLCYLGGCVTLARCVTSALPSMLPRRCPLCYLGADLCV